MKQAWKEYVEVCKLSWKWMKKHWKGYLFVCILCYILGYGIDMLYQSSTERNFEKKLEEES